MVRLLLNLNQFLENDMILFLQDAFLVVPANQKGVIECTSLSSRDKVQAWVKNGK